MNSDSVRKNHSFPPPSYLMLRGFRMNGSSYPYNHGPHPNQPIPPPGAPFPAPGVPYPYPMQQPHLEGHNFNVAAMPPPVNIPEGIDHVTNGHHAMSYPPHPVVINPMPGSGNRYYYPARMPEEHGPVPFRAFVPTQNNVPIYTGQEATAPRDDLFTPIQSELHPDYRVNANTYGPRPDAVWAPNPGEMFTFGDMRSALPQAPPLAAEVFPPVGFVRIPLVRSKHSSPVEGVGARVVGGPVSGPGAAEIPTVSANGPSTAPVPSRLAVGADRLARERPSVAERLAAAAHAYEAAGADDQELEAGLQALERRIDTEFGMAD